MNKFKRKILKKIPTLIFILLCFSIVFIYLCLRDFLIFFSLVHNYYESGNSIFFPFIPYINILWFLPEKYQVLKFSVGQLVDFIIFDQISCYIDGIIWHSFVKRYLIKDSQSSINFSEILGSTGGSSFAQYQNSFITLDLEKDLKYSNNTDFIKNDYNNQKKIEEIDRFYENLNKKGFGIKYINKTKLFQKSNFLFNEYLNYLLFIYNYSFFKIFRMFYLKYPHYYPEINCNEFNRKLLLICGIILMKKLLFHLKTIFYLIYLKNNILEQTQNKTIIVKR